VAGLVFTEWPDWVVVQERPQDFSAIVRCPAYSISLDAALTLVPAGALWSIVISETRVRALVGRLSSYAWTPALAMCAAALKARSV
jgi:hypothetical protein